MRPTIRAVPIRPGIVTSRAFTLVTKEENSMDEKLRLGKTATITCSGEQGRIIGIATYEDDETRAFLRYKAADGRAVEAWWPESALTVE